jgi:hypothetical protein
VKEVNTSTYTRHLWRDSYALLLFFTLVNAARPAPFQAQADSDRSASINGVVSNALNGGGQRKAYVRLAPAVGTAVGTTYSVMTSDKGTFTIENVAPGSYRLEAECAGFLNAQYGGGSLGNAGVSFRLSAGDNLTGVEIKMTPQAILSGRVLDQDGDPWPHAYLRIMHSVWKKGKQQIEVAESSDFLGVDDRGEFRIFSLAPGRYYVLAEPDLGWELEHHPDVNGRPTLRQQPTWYPSSPNIESSIPLTLAAGQQERGVEIRLRRGTGGNFHIRGKVSGAEAIPLPQGDPRWTQRRIWARRTSTMVDLCENIAARLDQNGSFEIAGVTSGTYEVWIAQGFPVLSPLSHASVQVNGQDVDDLLMELRPPQTLHVSIRVEGNEAPNLRVPVYLEAADYFGGIEPFSTANDDGSFDFHDVGLARYRVYAQAPVRDQVYLKLLRYGNVESHNGSFALDSYGVPLELVFSTRGAKLAGSISTQLTSNQTSTATTPRVVLIPDTTDNALREFQTRVAVFDQNGAFSIAGIAPGSYRLYGFENLPEDIWLATDFLKELESSGVALEFAEGDAINLKIPLLGKAETDKILAKLGFN